MNWISEANKIKNFIIFEGHKIFNLDKRKEIVHTFYSCKSEVDYKLFTLSYNQQFLNLLM